ncbi:MAG TPA: MBG domain-containing protein, partial [Candidatus Limnocylindrales bacterium]|nr:MBG domain-containing protein [Candidatus Limnocylindrales bacterium]
DVSPIYGPFVLGEDASDLETAPTCSTLYVEGDAPGDYATGCSGGVSANYDFSYVAGNFHVGKATLVVTAESKGKLLGAANPTLTASFTGFKNGEVLSTSDVSGEPSLTTTATIASSVGTYPISVGPGSLASNNYMFSFVGGTLTVTYRFDGFLQPINDTAHEQVCSDTCPISIFKAGSTIPVKFDLKRADGTTVSAGALPIFTGYVRGGTLNSPVTESVYTDLPTAGSTFTATGGHYQYNWSTKGLSAGYFYRIGVKLDDGTTYFVYIGLK